MSVRDELHRLVDTLGDEDAADLLRRLTLRADLDHAGQQLSRGEFADYDESTIQDLADSVKSHGQLRLAEERHNKVR